KRFEIRQCDLGISGMTRLYPHVQPVLQPLTLVRFEDFHAVENPENASVRYFTQVADCLDGCRRLETFEATLRRLRHFVRPLVESVETYLFNLRVNVVHRSRPSEHCRCTF